MECAIRDAPNTYQELLVSLLKVRVTNDPAGFGTKAQSMEEHIATKKMQKRAANLISEMHHRALSNGDHQGSKQ